MRLIKNLNEVSTEILREYMDSVQRRDVNEVIQNPNKLLDVLRELYKACVSFNANYNYYTFFIVSTGSLHWKYLITAYPKISENLIKFLGLEPIFTPKTTNKEFQRDYAIWGHRPNGLAYNLYRLQALLWLYFEFSDVLNRFAEVKSVFAYVVQEVEDLKKSYFMFAEKYLSTCARIQDIPGFEQLGAWDVEYYLKIGGPDNILIVEYCNSYLPTYYKHVRKEVMYPLSEFLDTIGPGLFLGVVRLHPSRDRYELQYGELIYCDLRRWFYPYVKRYYQIEW